MNYIPLGIKTHYELLSSLITIDSIVDYCKDNNIDCIGIVDSNMFYVAEFYEKCIHNNINPIIGINVCGVYLYALNYEGYKSLCRLSNFESVNRTNIFENCEGVLPVIFSKTDYIEFSKYFSDVYFGYSDFESKKIALEVTSNVVYIQESYYINENDSEYLKYIKLIKDNKNIDYLKEYNFDNYINYDIDLIDAESTKEFSKLFKLEIPKRNFILPKYCEKSYDKLTQLCKKGLIRRLNGRVDEKYINRLNYELNIINNMGFVDYFLIVYDFILYAKKNNIYVGPGRGSASGSLVSYTLGITEVDPIKYDLIFERFLNPERVTLPDIDIDIEYIRRDEVINYITDKYGKDNVSHIITFSTYQPKQCIIDVGKVLDINSSEISKICKLIKFDDTFKKLENNKEFMSFINSKSIYRQLFDISKHIEGIKKNISIHAAGIIIDKEKIHENVPIYFHDNKKLVAYTKDFLEYYGLLKMDLLSLENLTTLRKMVEVVNKYNSNFSLKEIDFNNQKTFNVFNKKLTLGIFQFDTRSMLDLLNVLKVDSFNDIVALNALNRPGPRDNIGLYARGKSNPHGIKYILPELKSILSETYGVIVYQEQIMEIFKSIGGYSYSEADNIRRAISKKKEDIILKEKCEFVKRLSLKGISEDKANEIYSLILKFANYGFNKSHSVSYSFISYYLAYLKANYPLYFYKVMLDNNINNSSTTYELIKEAKILGIEFMNIDINKSSNEYIIYEDKLICPFNIIKDLNKEVINKIIFERNNGNYESFISFVKRNKIDNDSLLLLIKSGSFNTFNNRKTLEENMKNILNYIKLCNELGTSLEEPELEICNEYNEEELFKDEVKLFGFSISNHPVMKYDRRNCVLSRSIESYFDKFINYIGMITSKKEIITKNGESMCFLRCSDEYGEIDITIFPKVYSNYSSIRVNDILLFNGHVEKRLNNYQLVVNEIRYLK